jgi:MoaA/NifB/PqqE/SkfB family radical SAM enzyme
MCSIGIARAERQKDFMGDTPFDIVEKTIAEAGRHGAYVELLGGEPTLYKKLGETIQLLTDHKLPSYITTNGFTLKKRAREMVAAGLKVLLISMDGWDEESSFKRGEVPGSFQAIADGIAEVKKERGRSMFPIIRIGSAITRVNYHSLDKIADAVYQMGVRRWSIQNYFFMTDSAMAEHRRFKLDFGVGDQVAAHHIAGEDSYLDREQVEQLRQALARTRQKLAGPMRDMRVDFNWDLDLNRYYSPQPPAVTSTCVLPTNRLDVYPDGRIAICLDGHTVGNIRTGTIREAWNGEQMRHFRQVLDEHRVMPMCFRCCGIMNDLKFDETYTPTPKSSLVTISAVGAR